MYSAKRLVMMVVVTLAAAVPVKAEAPLPAIETALQRSRAAIEQSNVEVEMAAQKLSRLRQLFREGFASTLEVEKAKLHLETSRIKRQSFHQFQDHVVALMNNPNAVDGLRSNRFDGQPKLVISIPGMTETVGQLQLGRWSVPATFDLIDVSIQIAERRRSAVADKNRVLADEAFHAELVSRLQRAGTNSIELEEARSRRKMTGLALNLIAIDQLASDRSVELLTELNQSGGDRFHLNSDIAAALQIESLRQQNLAQSRSLGLELAFRKLHQHKLQGIVGSGAVTHAEMQYTDFKVDYLTGWKAHSENSGDRVHAERAAFANVRRPPNNFDGTVPVIAVSENSLPDPLSRLTEGYLATAVKVARERLVDAAEVGAAESRAGAYRDYLSQLEMSQTDDLACAQERESIRLRLSVASATVMETKYRQAARALELAYVDAVANGAKSGDYESVMSSMEQLFEHHANVSALKVTAVAKYEQQLWKTTQTQMLAETGDAAWKELAESQRDLRASRANVEKISEEAAIRTLELKRFRLFRSQMSLSKSGKSPESVVSVEE